MIDSTHLLPPVSGLSTNPILFGVSEGLARLLPLPADDSVAALSPIAATGNGSVPAPSEPLAELLADPLADPLAEAGLSG